MEEKDILDSARSVATTGEYLAWARRCDERLESLRARCREGRRGRSTGTINSLIARIVRLTGARDDLRRRFERSAGGGERRERFSWSEIETAFARRVLTGAVVNLDYIEPSRFLEDAGDTVLDRVRDAMGRCVKVNHTAFNGEFVSSDKIAVKTVATKNRPLLPTSDLREWYENHVNLLYLSDMTRRDNATHFAWIKNLSRLVGSQLSARGHKAHICDRCMHYFRTSDKLSAHSEDCERMNECAIVLPTEEDKSLNFSNYERKERVPFVVYADLECALEREKERRTPNASIVQRHKAHSVGYYARCAFDDARSMYRAYRGESCVSWFVRELRDLAFRARDILNTVAPMAPLTADERERFRDATSCHVCERPFESKDARVRDHCHLTGRYRGPAHSSCNLNYKETYVISVFFHNLSGYDAHFIVRDVANAFPGSVELLPLMKESYVSFTKSVDEASGEGERRVKLRFVDSFKFLNASFEKLASYLDKSELKIARSEFPDLDDADFELIARKGVFPYEYVDDIDKLRETRLPPREAFYSSLTGDTVSDSDYERATQVWERFRIETLGEYSDLYLKSDVLLLADVFENFRDACMRSYGLDPAHYYTLPGYTWDAMLKYTGVRFELLTDIDMVLFVERGIRGGLSQCSNRYARANNKYVQSYNPSEPSSYLMYFDVNNLYGWAMCQSLPYEDFRWIEDVTSIDLMSVTPDSPIGYILEVDLAYPPGLHDSHADLPFCPTRDKPSGKRRDKLLATLRDKRRYVTHYRNLQQCVRHGLRVTRIHRILRFAQSPWLHGYIELNTRLRVNAKNEFEKNLYKLMNNAVFGKTMENVRNHSDVRLVTRWDGRFGAEMMIA
ncbi:uncharacterized protein LOC126851837 [Cataglyphis hispanica]|uniref:uncharacterized protein LOC126851837 n=1 Tax=Cataglyphis hispanica TaxID=1086592 RepID=UPI002180081D|nr:uncharacterized protein LOC126851837 [Cataglyphis hispanica]